MNDPSVLYGVLSLVAIIAVYVWVGLSLSAVFSKSGEEGWKAWVPFLNAAVLLQQGGFSGWLILIGLIPVIGSIALLVVMIMAFQRINRAFGFGGGMTALAVLVFPVWSSVVGWGSARWLGPDKAGPLRRGDTAPALDVRVATSPPGYGVPPRPPAPGFAAPGFAPPGYAPAAAAAPVALPAPALAAVPGRESEDESAFDGSSAPVPAFRSSARTAAPAADDVDDGDILLGRSHAPFTQTVPTSFSPAAALTPTAPPRRAFAPEQGDASAVDDSYASLPADTGPVSSVGAQTRAPVQRVPPAAIAPAASDPWAPPAADSPIAMRTTRYSPPADQDSHFDTSAEVSAVAGAPTLGAPRSARESVSAQHAEREIPDDEAAFDETILASRRRPAWTLTPPLGAPISVTSDVLIIGRRPGPDSDFPHAQLLPISDETRTMSKTHARLELQGDSWMIVDLDSTNGVVLVDGDGAEVEATPGVPERLTERFLLGDAELQIGKHDTASRSPRTGSM